MKIAKLEYVISILFRMKIMFYPTLSKNSNNQIIFE